MRATLFAAAATAALLGLGASAQAADLAVAEPAPVVSVPSFSWSGFYLGAQVGYGWQDLDARALGAKFGFKPKGWLIGAYAGYNVQLDNSPLVFGVETDFNWSDMDDRRSIIGGFVSVKTDTKWAGATRARVGYAFDNVLFYAAGGVAYAKQQAKVSVLGVTAKDSKTAVGWTVGAGADIAVTNNVIARVEYRYTDYGKDTLRFFGARARIDSTEHRVMAGLAYKF